MYYNSFFLNFAIIDSGLITKYTSKKWKDWSAEANMISRSTIDQGGMVINIQGMMEVKNKRAEARQVFKKNLVC